MLVNHCHQGPLVELRRGSILESVHEAAIVETARDGGRLRFLGNPDLVTTFRSAAKPLQAIPLTTLPGSADLDLSDEELAICCASHPGEPRHAALAASVLALSGFLPDDLVCPSEGSPPSPLKNGCSGNHAGILLSARLLGAPLNGYEQPSHPAQRWIATIVREMSGCARLLEATDGCGIPTFGLSLRSMALAYAQLVQPESPWRRIPEAMARHPELLGPPSRIDGCIIQASGGRIVAKTGAEGLLCMGHRELQRGLALKIRDGNSRAAGILAVEALVRLGWITEAESRSPVLAPHASPEFKGPGGEVTSRLRLAAEGLASL